MSHLFNPCSILLHLLLHLTREQTRLALFTLLELAFAIGLGFQAFRGRAAAFFAASGGSDGNGEQEEEENAETAHVVSSEL